MSKLTFSRSNCPKNALYSTISTIVKRILNISRSKIAWITSILGIEGNSPTSETGMIESYRLLNVWKRKIARRYDHHFVSIATLNTRRTNLKTLLNIRNAVNLVLNRYVQ